jgi:thioesterase domain-containing protein/acyl carrier protein
MARLPVSAESTLPQNGILSVGHAAPGREIVLLDDEGQAITAPDVTGTITIVAQTMASGYWQDPEATAARFTSLEDGRRQFNSGDLGRWNERGELEYIGRSDNMLKIRGYRVEPAEIESRMRAKGEVRDVVVVGRPADGDSGPTILVAYVVPDPKLWDSAAAMRRRLANELPSYMVPAVIAELTELPRNPNGKIDRAELPDPASRAPSARVAAPGSPEAAVADIVALALGLDDVGVDDDIFALGADSLAVEEIILLLEDKLELQLDSATLLENPTPAQIAALQGGDHPVGHLVDGVMTTLADGQGTPIFIFAGAGAPTIQLRELAQSISSGRPVHAFQGFGLEGKGWPDLSVGRMTRRYLAVIRRIQPVGPYVLAGYSLGTLVAYEAARQLIGAGQSVAYLGLLDPPTDDRDDRRVRMRRELQRVMAGEGSQYAAGDGTSILRRAMQAKSVVAAFHPYLARYYWRDFRAGHRSRAWYDIGVMAAHAYGSPSRPLADVSAFVYIVEGSIPTITAEWFLRPWRLWTVEGDHWSMLRRPFVGQLAERMRQDMRLSESLEPGSPAATSSRDAHA